MKIISIICKKSLLNFISLKFAVPSNSYLIIQFKLHSQYQFAYYLQLIQNINFCFLKPPSRLRSWKFLFGHYWLRSKIYCQNSQTSLANDKWLCNSLSKYFATNCFIFQIFSYDSRWLIAASMDSTISVWDISTGK